jgi:hypothetical protein
MAPAADALQRRARDFALKVQSLLNTTVCDGVMIAAVVAKPDRVHVGCGLAPDVLVPPTPFPVRVGRRKPSCWLDVSYRLCLDRAGYLMVMSSYFGVYANAVGSMCLCHFDYERDKPGYPEAHLQVHGESAALTAMRPDRDQRRLERLHFPSGGRRYRVILEDVIEFLVAEGFASPRRRWAEAIARERAEYEQIQLRAAVRADPETARDELRGLERET